MQLDLVALEGDLVGFFIPLAEHHQFDFRAGLAAHQLHRFAQRQAFHKRLVDFQDQVAGLDAGLAGRGAVHRGNHLDETVFHGDFDAQAAELTGGGDLQVVKLVRGQVAGVRVQFVEHAANGGFQQFAVINLIDIGAADTFHDFGKGTQFIHGHALLASLLIQCRVFGMKAGEGDG